MVIRSSFIVRMLARSHLFVSEVGRAAQVHLLARQSLPLYRNLSGAAHAMQEAVPAPLARQSLVTLKLGRVSRKAVVQVAFDGLREIPTHIRSLEQWLGFETYGFLFLHTGTSSLTA